MNIVSATITGSLILNGVNISSITGSESSINALNSFTASAATTGSNQFNGNQTVTGSVNITGSLIVTGSIIGTVTTASYVLNAVSASYALVATTSSYALVATSASYALVATSASYSNNSTSASYSNNSTSASYALAATSASYALVATSASYASNSDLLDGRDSLTFANTGSNNFVGTQNINGSVAITGSLTTTGAITAQTLNVQQVTSSIVYSSGSNIFGNSVSNTQSMTGSVGISGSLSVNGVSTLSGALSGTSATFSGQITSTVTADRVLEASSATTSGLNLKFGNTGGNGYLGLENSAGGDFAAGAYSLYLIHSGNRSIVLGTNGSIRYTVNGSGNHDFKTGTATFGGALSGTSATFSGLVTINTNTRGLVLNRDAVTNYNGIGYQTAGVQKWFVGMRENLSSNNYIIYSEVGTDVLTLNQTTGAATFSSSVTATAFIPSGATVPTNGMYLSAANTLDFATNTTNRLTITSGGNVGIGITTPLAKLTTKGADGTPGATDKGIFQVVDASLVSLAIGGYTALPYGMWMQVIDAGSGNSGTYPLILNPIGGNVGIGTTSPGSILDVQQSNATNMGISFMNTFGATSNTAQTVDITSKLVGSGLTGQVGSMIRTGKEGDYSSGAARDAYMSFSVALNDTLTEALRITSGGNVGIGTTVPTSPLTIAKTLSANQTYLNFDNVTNTKYNWGVNWSVLGATNINVAKIEAIYPSDNDIGLAFSTYGSGGLGERVRINKEGNVGIGTTSPNGRLNTLSLAFAANMTLGTATEPGLSVTASNGGLYGMYFGVNSNGNSWIQAGRTDVATAYNISLQASGGNVGIGTAGPGYKFVVSNTSAALEMQLLGADTSGQNIYFGSASNGLYSYIQGFYNAAAPYLAFGVGTEVMRIKGGNVGIGTTSPGYQLQLSTDSAAKPSTNTWTISSDSRVKENITPYTKGLSAIMAINPVNYDYNGKAGFGNIKNNIGVIAQDVLEILPESVSTYKTKLEESDAKDTELYNFNSHALTYILINAIKELKAEIDLLKAIASIEPTDNNLE